MIHFITSNPIIYYLSATIIGMLIGMLVGKIFLVTIFVLCAAVFYVRRIRNQNYALDVKSCIN